MVIQRKVWNFEFEGKLASRGNDGADDASNCWYIKKTLKVFYPKSCYH